MSRGDPIIARCDLRISARGQIRVTDREGQSPIEARNNTGGITVWAPTQIPLDTPWDAGEVVIERGADLVLDLRAATGTNYRAVRFEGATDRLIVRGKLTFRMPAGSLELLQNQGAKFGDGDGLILWSLEGAADSALPRNAGPINHEALDGTVRQVRSRTTLFEGDVSLDGGRRLTISGPAANNTPMTLRRGTADWLFTQDSGGDRMSSGRPLRISSSDALGLILQHGTSERVRVTAAGVRLTGIPTSSAGLSAGDIWNDGGTLRIVT